MVEYSWAFKDSERLTNSENVGLLQILSNHTPRRAKNSRPLEFEPIHQAEINLTQHRFISFLTLLLASSCR